MEPFIAQHLAGVSRTYALVVPMLPRELVDPVGLAYLLMRIVDTIEDSPELTADQRHAQFEHLHAALAGDEQAAQALALPIGDLEAERALQQVAPEVIHRVLHQDALYSEVTCQCARNMADGVELLLQRSAGRNQPYPAVHDLVELREYCYYVAGTVGEMLCAMMAYYLGQPEFGRWGVLAVELGTGLQLVNILKDARRDAGQGRRYLPPADTPAARAEVFNVTLAEARRCLTRGVEYVLALPADEPALRQFCGLPIVWGALTLRNAERDPAAAKITRDKVGASIEQFGELAADDVRLRTWLSSLLDVTQPNDTTPAAERSR